MSKQEQPAFEKSVEPAPETKVPEKKEPKSDSEYFSMVSRYFNKRAQQIEAREGATEEDAIEAQFLRKQEDSLTKIANRVLLEKISPKDVSSSLGRIMIEVGTGEDNATNQSMPEEMRERFEKEYLESKALLIATGKKIFPKKDTKLTAPNLESELKNIAQVNLAVVEHTLDEDSRRPIMSVREIQEKIDKNPEELLKEIETVLHEYAFTIASRTYGKFKDFQEGHNNDYELSDEGKKNAAIITESIYGLSIMKDELMKRVYGRADVTPKERYEIDRLLGKTE